MLGQWEHHLTNGKRLKNGNDIELFRLICLQSYCRPNYVIYNSYKRKKRCREKINSEERREQRATPVSDGRRQSAFVSRVISRGIRVVTAKEIATAKTWQRGVKRAAVI